MKEREINGPRVYSLFLSIIGLLFCIIGTLLNANYVEAVKRIERNEGATEALKEKYGELSKSCDITKERVSILKERFDEHEHSERHRP